MRQGQTDTRTSGSLAHHQYHQAPTCAFLPHSCFIISLLAASHAVYPLLAPDACRAINAEVVAVSVDSKFSHLAWTKQPRK